MSATAAAPSQADALGWGVLWLRAPEPCPATDAEGVHLFVVAARADGLEPARWRCCWCGSDCPPASFWCVSP